MGFNPFTCNSSTDLSSFEFLWYHIILHFLGRSSKEYVGRPSLKAVEILKLMKAVRQGMFLRPRTVLTQHETICLPIDPKCLPYPLPLSITHGSHKLGDFMDI